MTMAEITDGMAYFQTEMMSFRANAKPIEKYSQRQPRQRDPDNYPLLVIRPATPWQHAIGTWLMLSM
ncbi:hypothetical protein ACWELJ_08035 [Nocardia sp. NPDC004582]